MPKQLSRSKTNNRPKPYFIFELTLIAIVLAVTAIVIYNSNSHTQPIAHNSTRLVPKSPTPTPSPSKQPSPTPLASTAKNTESPPCVPNGKYVTISQWGVKFPVCNVIEDIQYEVESDGVHFYSPELYPKYPYCGPTQTGNGALTRVPANPQSTVYAINAGVVNGYQYYFNEAQQPCDAYGAPGSPDSQLDQDTDNALIKVMRTGLQAAN